jgi:hypothetical protein
VLKSAALISAALVLAALLVSPSPGSERSRRGSAPAMYRAHTFKLNLDRDPARERVQVYDLHVGPLSTPVTYFRVSDRRKGAWVSVQLKLVFQSPGSSESGLVQAWLRDLNSDKRVEIAVRDYATPSVGEALTIYRQKKARSLRFLQLQRIVGDKIVMTSHKPPVEWKVSIKANHAPDGRDHYELWQWDSAGNRWRCTADCVPR